MTPVAAGAKSATGIAFPLPHELCTTYFRVLVNVVAPVVTVTNPSLAPAGTVAVNKPGSVSVEVAVTPLNFTTDDELNPSPRMPTLDPTLPLVLSNEMNAFRPTERLKTVPHPAAAVAPVVQPSGLP